MTGKIAEHAEQWVRMAIQNRGQTAYEEWIKQHQLPVSELLELTDMVYDLLNSKWQALSEASEYAVNPFEVISYLEGKVVLLTECDPERYGEWMEAMFELAIRYSDQAGRAKKFELYKTLIESTKGDLERHESSIFFYTRGLNRLAQLTEYWMGADEARPLWKELADYALNSMGGEERTATLDVIKGNAPWFAEEYAEKLA